MSTAKQKKAAFKTSENLRKDKPEPIGAVLRASGYTRSVSERPKSVTSTKGYKEELEPLLKRHNVTKEKYIENIGEAMNAKRVVQVEGDFYETEVPDHAMRLSANKQAKDLLNFTEEDIKKNPELVKAMSEGLDELELTKLILRKS